MYAVTLNKYIEPPWMTMDPIRLGHSSGGSDTPNAYLCVERHGEPLLRGDVYLHDETSPFSHAEVWRGFVFVGLGSHLHLVNLESRASTSLRLRSYFGYLHCLDRCILVASGEDVTCVGPDGRVLWTSAILGIDGVVIHRVEGGFVEGEGEWDPPGGWRPFKLKLDEGTSV